MGDTLSAVLMTEYSELLAVSRNRTLARVRALEHDWQSIVDAADTSNLDDEHDPEGSTVAYERAMVISLLESARVSLVALDVANARLSEGTYGTCVRCGLPIGIERLRADVAATSCIACMTDQSRLLRPAPRRARGTGDAAAGPTSPAPPPAKRCG
ncbi:MAG: TraR/DksA family transcriptional regulator [Acidimicrobiales bacterium]